MNFAGIFEKYGPLGFAVIVLGALLWKFQADAAKERTDHTYILVEQMSSLRHACDPKAP